MGGPRQGRHTNRKVVPFAQTGSGMSRNRAAAPRCSKHHGAAYHNGKVGFPSLRGAVVYCRNLHDGKPTFPLW